ncbi:hypothetical protein DPSP01_005438 [Paraphaeosphaeria sporulosa]
MGGVAKGSSLLSELGLTHENDGMNVEEGGESGQQPLFLDKGFSDDEEYEDLFGGSWKPRASTKNKKKPRSLSDHDEDDLDAPEPSPTKKPRTSLFGGLSLETDDAVSAPPPTPGIGLGMRFSSMNLEQQYEQAEKKATSGPYLGTALDQSQLDDAQRLSSSLPDEKEPERPEENEGPAYTDDPIESYGLRKNINRQGAASTHIDIDQSGNYDPVEEARKKTVKARIAKQAKQAKQNKRKSQHNSGEDRAERKPKLIFKRKIAAIGTLINITDNQENWPDGHSIMDSEEEAEREELLAFFRKDTPTRTRNLHIPDPTGEYDDLTGHPLVRGCKSCRSDGHDCSMVIDAEYPCQDCVDMQTQCEPFIVPGVFGPCNRCVEQGQTCSFENSNGEPQMAMCDECLEADNLDCKARPRRGYRSDRIDLDRVHYGEDRKYLSCTHCREEKKRCSLKKKTDRPPCKRCKKQKIGCHFYDVAPPEKENPAKNKKETEEEATGSEKPKDPKRTLLEEIAPETSIPGSDFFSPEDLAYMEADSSADESDAQDDEASENELIEDAEGHRGFLATIKTSFAHPMVFSINPPGHPKAVLDCDFCYIPVFGFVGHFEREVHAIQWSNGQGYTEFGNGHREEKDATTMCHECTFHRLQIMVCSDHVIRHIELHEDQLDYHAASEVLISVEGGTPQMQYELQRWCSLCFSLARHQCCSLQPFVGADDEGDGAVMMEGCGLRLCDRCAQELGQVYQNNLHDMVTALDKKAKPKQVETDDGEEAEEQGTIRADVGLLKLDGLLMKCVQGGADGGDVE